MSSILLRFWACYSPCRFMRCAVEPSRYSYLFPVPVLNPRLHPLCREIASQALARARCVAGDRRRDSGLLVDSAHGRSKSMEEKQPKHARRSGGTAGGHQSTTPQTLQRATTFPRFRHQDFASHQNSWGLRCHSRKNQQESRSNGNILRSSFRSGRFLASGWHQTTASGFPMQPNGPQAAKTGIQTGL